MDLLYSYIPKRVQSAKTLLSYGVIKNMPDLKFAIFLRKIGEHSKFRYKSSEYQNFLLIQQENGNCNMFCKFQDHSMQICFKLANFKCLKIEKACIYPFTLWLWRLTLPRVRWYPHFFPWKWPQKMSKNWETLCVYKSQLTNEIKENLAVEPTCIDRIERYCV